MSAITGIFNRNRKTVHCKQMQKMNNQLSHQGPDGSAIACEGMVGFGHQMLFTTPESLHEKLPFELDGLIITADARIDNRSELSKELGIENVVEISDSYFILKSYQKWGENCPEKLLGDFVFAIWDKKEETLFCARDHMGIRPFYYFISDELFLFSSEFKAILEILEFKPEINEKILSQMLSFIFDDKKNTIFEDIFKLPPASKLTIDIKDMKVEEYWFLDLNLMQDKKTEKEYQEEFLEIFVDCVRCRIRSAFPIGFELSGGLDTSSILSVANKLNLEEKKNLKLNSYTTIFEKPKTDESNYAKAVVRDKEIEPHFIVGDGSALKDIEEIIWYADVPYVPFNNYSLWQRCFEVQKDGNRVLLTGACGDNVLAVRNAYLTELLRKFNWRRLLTEISGIKESTNKGYFRLLLLYFLFPLIPESVKNLAKKDKEESIEEILFNKESEFAKETDIYQIAKKSEEYDNKASKRVKEFHYKVLMDGIIQFTTEFDHNLQALFSVETRYPYLDKRLIEFCYSLPSEMKVKDGWDKYILRSSLEGILPEEVQWRVDKTNYAFNFYENFHNYEKDNIGPILLRNKEKLSLYVDFDKIIDISERFKEGNLYDEYKKGNLNNVMALWLALILALWFEDE